MPSAPTTRVSIDPPRDQWRLTARRDDDPPIVATGHQPTLWHPGILAKDLAADRFATAHHARALHIIVEHNALGPLSLDVPAREGDTLASRRLVLDPRPAALATPPNRLAPLDTGRTADQLRDAGQRSDLEPVRIGLQRLAEVYGKLGAAEHLAAQTAAVLDALKRPYVSALPRTLASSAVVTAGFVDRLMQGPARCVRAYNRAAAAHPEAGIRPLYEGRDVVEAPLWAQGDGACTPVYIDLGDSRRPYLFTQGQHLDLTGPEALGYLRPRALSLSAIMRAERCGLFIHGKGGGIYDRVTERWWRGWVDKPLAPMAVVSADATLPLDAPIATADQRNRAVWFAHHLPFNIDRFAEAQDDAEARLHKEKRQLLDRMDDDRDKRRRSKAFKRLHQINAELRDRHRDRLDRARAEAKRARVGLANARLARRRDWCFALYPESQMHELAKQV